jgi:hypothetical protein
VRPVSSLCHNSCLNEQDQGYRCERCEKQDQGHLAAEILFSTQRRKRSIMTDHQSSDMASDNT